MWLNCNFDFGKLQELANNHRALRLMVGHAETDIDSRYALQTIRDNISLLMPDILDEINYVAASARNLLSDKIRKMNLMIGLIAVICSEIGITQWCQSHHSILKGSSISLINPGCVRHPR